MESNGQSQLTTGDPQATTPLRPIDFNGHTPPLTDADVDHAIGNYGPAAPYQPHDRWDAHHADRAFGDGTGGAA